MTASNPVLMSFVISRNTGSIGAVFERHAEVNQ
jgi:hypothetical protein